MAFSRFVSTTWPPALCEAAPDVRWFFATRQRVEGGDLRCPSRVWIASGKRDAASRAPA
jgi:hypothetical protein